MKKANKIDMDQVRTNIKTGMPMIPFDKMFKRGISKWPLKPEYRNTCIHSGLPFIKHVGPAASVNEQA